MAVRVSDNLKPQNDSTEFPVAYGEDIWLDKNKGSGTPNYDSIQNMYNNSELGSGGSSIQVDTLPIPSEDEVGNIYQYIAESGTYKNGYFYRCDSFSYLGWEDGNSNVVYTKDLKNAVGKKVYTVSGGTYSEVGTITELADDNSIMTYDDGNGNTIDCTRNNSYDVSDAGYTWTEIVYSSNLQEGDGIDITNDTISVVDRLVVTDTMPTASASLLDATRLFVGTTTSDFIKGGIYECQEVAGSDPTEYAWVLISTNPLEAGKGITIEDDVISADTNIFSGTLDKWDALTPTEQAKYDFIATPDEAVEDIADAIIDGDMRAITSNAVAQVVPSDASASNQLVSTATLNNRIREVYRIPYNMTITNFLARFVNRGIHVGEVFIQGDIGDTTVDSWCSYEANIVSTAPYVGDIKITNLNNGTEFLYKSYDTESFNWVLASVNAPGVKTVQLPPTKILTVKLGSAYNSVFTSIQIQGMGSRMVLLEYNNTSLYGKILRDGTEYTTERGSDGFTIGTLTFANSSSKKFTITNFADTETEIITVIGNVIGVEVN